jgi:hypothetical protein
MEVLRRRTPAHVQKNLQRAAFVLSASLLSASRHHRRISLSIASGSVTPSF